MACFLDRTTAKGRWRVGGVGGRGDIPQGLERVVTRCWHEDRNCTDGDCSEAFAYSLDHTLRVLPAHTLGFAFNHLRTPCVLSAMQTVSCGDQAGSKVMPSGWEPASGHIPARNYAMWT